MDRDQRATKLANSLVTYSLRVQPGEKVLIETRGMNQNFTADLIKAVYAAGGQPFLSIKFPYLDRQLMMGCTQEQLDLLYKQEADRMHDMDCYIGIRHPENCYEENGVPFDKVELWNARYEHKLLMEDRCPGTRWVVLRYPTPAMAQAASMSTEEFTDFYFDVCTLDYARMSRAMDPLKELLERTDRVRLLAKDTDLSFSIKGVGGVKCDGGCNIPDGEVYSAPVLHSVNGVITYNTPSLVDGFSFEGIRLEFKDGKIVQATANDSARLNAILDTDAGARYVGEFAIGVNPFVLTPMNETLFDEKIMGSIHFTPGNCASGLDNGNRSQVHWDLVLIQTPEWGGGEIWFDDVLIRKDGMFVVPELLGLNPEHLK